MKKFSHNIITASLGAAIALGGFHLINNLEKEETTKKPIVVSEQPKIQLSSPVHDDCFCLPYGTW